MTKASAAEVARRIHQIIELFELNGNRLSLKTILSRIYECDDTQDKAVRRKFDRDREKMKDLFYDQDIAIVYDKKDDKYVLESDVKYFLQLKLTEEDVQALAAGMKLSGHFLPIFGNSADRVWAQLKNSISNKSLQREGEMLANATTVAFPVSSIDKDVFHKVVSAIFDRQVLKVTQYKNFDGEEKNMHISPWFIYFKHHSWYLWGKAEEYNDSGPFRISRMRLIQPISSKKYENPPEGFNMRHFVYSDHVPGQAEKTYKVRLRIHPPFASPAMETEWFPGQNAKWEDLREKKTAVYELETNGLDDITRWIMRALDSFEVLEPEELKDKIRNKIEQYQGRYPK